MDLKERDRIIAAFAERASGPGWANQPIWVLVRDGDNSDLRLECIQPDEQTAEMAYLYDVSVAAHSAMTSAVVTAINRKLRRASP